MANTVTENVGTQVPADVFKYITKNAGVIANAFTPTTGTLNKADIKGATTGGLTFTDKPSYKDVGEDIDNMPKNTMELMEIESREVSIAGTFVSLTPHTIKDIIGAADITTGSTTPGTITPRDTLKISDFQNELWFITDYGKGGWIAVQIKNVLNEEGLSVKSTDKEKGQFAFTFKAHYSSANISEVPYKIYYKEGTAETGASGTPHGDAVTAS